MRRNLTSVLFTSLRATLVVAVLVGILYPLAVWALGQGLFPFRANGSFITGPKGQVVGSALIGQEFSLANGNPDPRYFQPRPSAAGRGYDPTSSGGSNLGPSNPALISAVAARVVAYRQFNGLPPTTQVPIDAVTASGSGLDPDISEANALDQAPRVAASRDLPGSEVEALVKAHVDARPWGFLGEPTVNVLDLNLALDRLAPLSASAAP